MEKREEHKRRVDDGRCAAVMQAASRGRRQRRRKEGEGRGSKKSGIERKKDGKGVGRDGDRACACGQARSSCRRWQR